MCALPIESAPVNVSLVNERSQSVAVSGVELSGTTNSVRDLASECETGSALLTDTVQLLRDLVRAACVNDGTPGSGQEVRGVRVLQRFLADEIKSGVLEVRVLESAPGRASLIARLRGARDDECGVGSRDRNDHHSSVSTAPTAPTATALGLLGHLDVVPANPERWLRDPFGGELVNGEVWGRGTVDMLYLTAVFAAVTREAARRVIETGERMQGDLVLLAVADEEAGGDYGLKWLLHEYPDVVQVTEALSETGGMRLGKHVAIDVAEKGSAGRRLVIRGVSAHGSIPYGSTNAAARAGEILQRLAEFRPAIELNELWQQFVEARVVDAGLAQRLLHETTLDDALVDLGGIAGYAHAASRVTLSPTVLRAGSTHNVIPDEAHIDLDIRTLPGTTDDQVDAMLTGLLGDLAHDVEIVRLRGWEATASPADHPLFLAVSDAIAETEGSPVVPMMAAGGSDARLLRMRGVPAFGFGLLSESWSYEQYRERIHAQNERIDVQSVALTLEAARKVVELRLTAGASSVAF